MNSIVTVFRLAILAFVIAVPALVTTAVAPAGPTAASDQGVYDTSDLARVDSSGLPAPVAIAARDGARLAVRVYDAPGNTVILAIHGSSGNGWYYQPLAQFLSRKGKATVYTLDLRGHGKSDGRRGDVDYIGQLEDDVADVIAAIRARRPDARIVLLGHSAGGGLIVRYAGGGRGPAADGYVLLAPYLGPAAPTTKPDAGGWARPDIPAITALVAKAAQGDTSGQDAIVLRFNQPASIAAPGQVLAYSFRMVASFTPRPDLGRELSALRRPLLVLTGDRDESFHADQYGPTIAPHAAGTFRTLPGVTHIGLVVNPRTAEEIEAWLDRLP
jgi:non-heme chloroperoxidase